MSKVSIVTVGIFDEKTGDQVVKFVLLELAKELAINLDNCLKWMESCRASGDCGNWEWSDGEYTRGVDALSRFNAAINGEEK